MNTENDAKTTASEFCRRTSHAIRTPVGILRGVVTEVDGAPPEQREQLLAMGRRATAQLERLASRLSMFARLEHDDPYAPMRCDLAVALRSAIQDVERTRPRRRVAIDVDGIPETAPVLGDANALRMALSELVDNAVRFADRKVTVTLDVGSEVTARIANDGPCVADEPDQTGLGIGLTLARGIAARHRGAITRSERDGVWFAFTLPGA